VLRLPAWAWIAIAVVVVLIGVSAATNKKDETVKASDTTAAAPATEATSTSSSPSSSTTAAPPSTEADSTSVVPTTTPTTTTTTTTTTAAPTTVATTVPPTPPPTLPGVGDGTFIVGRDIQPGRYLAVNLSLCYWARLTDASGSLESIIANDNATGQALVDIAPTDGLFQSNRCQRWVVYFPPATPVTSFGEGSFVVNDQIRAGRYQSSGGDPCYWERTTGFGGTLDQIIANANASGPTVVDIAPSDVGFKSRGCGTWSLVG